MLFFLSKCESYFHAKVYVNVCTEEEFKTFVIAFEEMLETYSSGVVVIEKDTS